MNPWIYLALAGGLLLFMHANSYPYVDAQGLRYRLKSGRRVISKGVNGQPDIVQEDLYERQGEPGRVYLLKLGTTLQSPVFVGVG